MHPLFQQIWTLSTHQSSHDTSYTRFKLRFYAPLPDKFNLKIIIIHSYNANPDFKFLLCWSITIHPPLKSFSICKQIEIVTFCKVMASILAITLNTPNNGLYLWSILEESGWNFTIMYVKYFKIEFATTTKITNRIA